MKDNVRYIIQRKFEVMIVNLKLNIQKRVITQIKGEL